MVSFFIAFGFPIWYLNWYSPRECSFGGLVPRVENCRAGTPGSTPPRHIGIFFSLKIQETCTLTKFVEQKLSLCVKKLRNFMRVNVNSKRAI